MRNKNIYLGGSVVIGLMLVMTVFWIVKSTFSNPAASNQLVISCPEVVSGGETITCNVYANVVDTTVLSVNANYQFDDVITYKNFTIDNNSNLELYTSSENGFAVVSMNGITEDTLIGFLELTISDDVQPSTTYNIEFTNVEYSDSEYQMISLENAKTEIRTKNNIATLDNITIDGYTLNETFDKNVMDYTTTVNTDTSNIVISYTKTDLNSTVSGTGTLGSSLNLHYGTNTFYIDVLSEDGKVKNTYSIAVKRPYNFSTNNYKYDEVNNEMYVGFDSDTVVISNLEVLGDGLSYAIVDNQLQVLYGTEVVSTVKLLRFTSSYQIIDKEIYIGNNLSYGELISKIVSDTLDIKIVNSSDNVVSDNNLIINESNKLYIYNGDVKLDTYTFRMDYLNIDSSLVIDDNKKIIMRLPVGITYSELLAKIETSGSIEKISNNGATLNDNSIVKTGDKITIKIGSGVITYTLSILGDVTGDGIIEINDVGRLYRYYNGREAHLNIRYSSEGDDEAFFLAGDVVVDGVIEINDIGRLYRYYNGRVSDLEVIK